MAITFSRLVGVEGEVPNLDDVLDEGNSAGDQVISDLADPVDDQDAVTKAFLEDAIGGSQPPDGMALSIRSWDGSIGGTAINSPYDVALDADENVYVTDQDNQMIQVFTPKGIFLRNWVVADANNDLTGIAISPTNGRVYSAQTSLVTIQEDDGTPVSTFDASDGPAPFGGLLRGVAVDSDGKVYVCDPHNARVQIFDADGNYLSFLDGSDGTAFVFPMGVAVTDDGHVYVSDNDTENTVQKFTAAGTFVWSVDGSAVGDVPFATGNDLENIVLGPEENIYVCDAGNSLIHVYTPAGDLVMLIDGTESGGAGFASTNTGCAVSSTGALYVTKYDLTGGLRQMWVT